MKPADAETRERIVEGIGTTFVVEAGAGTGKTTLLVDRVTELLARGVPVTRLAVITFTRKAAAELVSRLGERLAARRDDGEAWADRALADLDLADIGTTDAFCQRILASFPLPADVPPGFAIADEIAEVALREEAWSRFLDDLGPEGAVWLERLRTLGASAMGLRGLADSLLEHRDLAPALEEVPASAPVLVDVFAATLESLRSLLALCSDPGDRLFTHLRDLVNEGEMAITLGGSAGERLLLSRRMPGGFKTAKNVGRKEAWHGRKDAVIAALTDLDRALNRAFEGRQAAEMHELVRRLRQYAAHYESLKRARGLLDFRDLAWRTRELLTRRPDVRQRVASRYDAILLDEVQDTDPLQMEIAFLLATNEPATDPLASPVVPGRLFLVGDPKQSIYRFRRADIELYERAKARLAAQGEAPDLVANFRSDPRILDLVNRVFDGWMTPPPEGDWQARYVPLVPARAADDGPGAGPAPATSAGQLDLFSAARVVEAPAGRPPRTALLLPDPARLPADGVPSADLRAAVERDACARLVRRILGLDGSAPWRLGERAARAEDIAVLVRKVAWGDLLLETLRRAGVPASLSGGRRFFAREEIRTLRILLESILDPASRFARFAALRCPVFALPDDDLVLRFADDPGESSPRLADAERRLDELAALARVLSVPELLERLATDTALLPVFGFRPDGAARVESLQLLLEASDVLGDAGFDSLPEFVRWLGSQEEGRPGPGDDEPGDLGGVSILTTHKAKGLEFPIVIVADLAGRVSSATDVVPDRDSGRLEIRLAGAGLETPGFRAARVLESNRQAAEEIRLLYVAMTRAREHLVLSWPPAKDGHLGPDGLPERIGVPAGVAADPGGALGTFRAGDLPPLPVPTPRVEASDREGGTFPPPVGAPVPSAVPSFLAPDGDSANEQQAKDFGTLVHAALEVWRADLSAESAVRRAAVRHPELAAHVGEAVELVERVLRDPAFEPVRAAVAGERGRLLREVPFLLANAPADAAAGTIDALLEEPDGALVILDWKTGHPPAAAAARQAATYANAVEQLTGRAPREVRFLLLSRSPIGVLSLAPEQISPA